jgi:hypothetical protein
MLMMRLMSMDVSAFLVMVDERRLMLSMVLGCVMLRMAVRMLLVLRH